LYISFRTDGTPADASDAAAELLLDGVEIFAIGVGPLVSKQYLTQIAGDAERVFMVESFKDLTEALIKDILGKTHCENRNQRLYFDY
jgi:hypothetical protein